MPVTTFAPIATGGTAQQPITSFNYQNIGVNIDITPRTHHDDDVSLTLKIAVTNISGTGFGGLPTFGNREINTIIRLRDGETNMLAGLIRDEERHSLDGHSRAERPAARRPSVRHTTKSTTQTDIILTLTPHIIRVLDLTEADLRPFRVGRDSLAPLAELPLPPARTAEAARSRPKPEDNVEPIAVADQEARRRVSYGIFATFAPSPAAAPPAGRSRAPPSRAATAGSVRPRRAPPR